MSIWRVECSLCCFYVIIQSIALSRACLAKVILEISQNCGLGTIRSYFISYPSTLDKVSLGIDSTFAQIWKYEFMLVSGLPCLVWPNHFFEHWIAFYTWKSSMFWRLGVALFGLAWPFLWALDCLLDLEKFHVMKNSLLLSVIWA